jgi:hypothetical protein
VAGDLKGGDVCQAEAGHGCLKADEIKTVWSVFDLK